MIDIYMMIEKRPLFFAKENSKVVLNDMYIVGSFKLPKISHFRLQIPS
jgi:hypothetical protein